MPTLLDLSENASGGAFSGWGVQTNGVGSTVVGDPTVLIPGLLTTKHTAVDSGLDPMRADLSYGTTPSPAGALNMTPGTTHYFRFAIKWDATYVPSNVAGKPRFNTAMDFHGNSTVYTPIEVDVNPVSSVYPPNAVSINIQGGGASLNTPTQTRFYDIAPWAAGDTFEFQVKLTISATNTGVVEWWFSRNGGTMTQAFVDNGGNISSGDSGMYVKLANYSTGNIGAATKILYHSGVVKGSSFNDLAVPATGNATTGYVDVSRVPIVGGTIQAMSIATERGCRFVMPESGTPTHLGIYFDFDNTANNIESCLGLFADSGGQATTRLAQTRVISPSALSPDGVYWYQLAKEPVTALNAGQAYWIKAMAQSNATHWSRRVDLVGSGNFFGAGTGWASDGFPNPSPVNSTGTPNQTMSLYMKYRTPTNPFRTRLPGWQAAGGTDSGIAVTRSRKAAWGGTH